VGNEFPNIEDMTEDVLKEEAMAILNRMVDIFIRIRGYILYVNAKTLTPTQVRINYILRLYDVEKDQNIPSRAAIQEYVTKTVDALFQTKPILSSLFDRTDMISTLTYLFTKMLNSKDKAVFLNSALLSTREVANVLVVVSLLKEIHVNNRYDLFPILEQYDPQLAETVREYQTIFESYKMWIPGKITNIWTGNLDVYAVEYPNNEERYVLGMDYIIDIDMNNYVQERLADCKGNLECEKELLPQVYDEIRSMVDSYKCLNEDSEDSFKQCMMRTMNIGS
jgi:hypothetical protein